MSGNKIWVARSDDSDIQSLCTVTLANESILEFNQVINRDFTRKEFFGWLYSTIKYRSGVNRTYPFRNKRMIDVINLIRVFESTAKRDKRVTCTKINDVGKVVNVEVEQNYYPLKKHKYILSISQGNQRVVYTHVEQPLLIYWLEKMVKSIRSCLKFTTPNPSLPRL